MLPSCPGWTEALPLCNQPSNEDGSYRGISAHGTSNHTTPLSEVYLARVHHDRWVGNTFQCGTECACVTLWCAFRGIRTVNHVHTVVRPERGETRVLIYMRSDGFPIRMFDKSLLTGMSSCHVSRYAGCRVPIPGLHATVHYLMRLYGPQTTP